MSDDGDMEKIISSERQQRPRGVVAALSQVSREAAVAIIKKWISRGRHCYTSRVRKACPSHRWKLHAVKNADLMSKQCDWWERDFSHLKTL